MIDCSTGRDEMAAEEGQIAVNSVDDGMGEERFLNKLLTPVEFSGEQGWTNLFLNALNLALYWAHLVQHQIDLERPPN